MAMDNGLRLYDRADGVKDHFCVGRKRADGVHEFWNHGRFLSAGQVFVGRELAESKLVTAEHERLRSAVVEAAQNLKRFQERHIDVIWHRELGEAQNRFNAAVQALNVFEAEHAIGQKEGW